MKNFSPTSEQQAALDAFQTGQNMVIEAGAGTGKTSTLRLLGESTDKKGLFVAYNKSVQTDAEASFPANVHCRTAHSLAYGGMMNKVENGKAIMEKLRNTQRVTSREVVAVLGIPSAGFQISSDHKLEAWIIARSAMEAVASFCNSANDEITVYNIKKIENVKDHAAYARYVLSYAQKAWADLQDPHGKLKFSHGHYLKIWALTNPRLNFDFIMLDEAQDANPVIAKIVESQTHAQQIMVGDRCQAIYGWNGAIDAMTNFSTERRLMLTQSFRFGDAVAEVANRFLAALEAPLRLTGTDSIDSKVESLTDPDVILCRTNAAVIQYAMEYQEQGKRVAIVGGTGAIESFVRGAEALMSGKKSSHSDLVAFKNWGEVIEYSESDEGRDLRIMVKLIQTYGVEAIMDVCITSVDEKDADLIVSTAHKAKGREWNGVRIGSDFKAPEEEQKLSDAEMMLLYVAVTRARLTLDYTAIDWIDRLLTAEVI